MAWPRILPFSEAHKTIRINPVFSGSSQVWVSINLLTMLTKHNFRIKEGLTILDLWELKLKLKIKVFWVGDRPKLRITVGIILYRSNNYLEEMEETPLSARM